MKKKMMTSFSSSSSFLISFLSYDFSSSLIIWPSFSGMTDVY